MNTLSKKEKGFVKDYIKTGNGTESALKNYDTEDENTAGVIASENLRKPKIQKAIADRLPDDLLEEKHLALLNKTEKKYDEEGEIVSEEIDAQAVAKGLDMAYKVKGSYAPDRAINLNLNQTIDPKDKGIIEIRDRYEEELRRKLQSNEKSE